MSAADCFRYIGAALTDAGIVELRHEHAGRWTSGLFDSLMPLRQAIAEVSAGGNTYVTHNAPARTADVLVTNCMRGRPLRDEQMVQIRRLVFDFDPLRDKGVPSTDAEVALAIQHRDRMVASLSAVQWAAPALGMSGNGAHALFRVKLPATAETREMLSALYQGLWGDFTGEEVEFDRTVRNPSRIFRLYGTRNRKGPSTPERPHRVADVRIPETWQGVSPRAIRSVAEAYARRAASTRSEYGTGDVQRLARTQRAAPQGTGDYSTLDAVAWFAAHGSLRWRPSMGKAMVQCPWTDEHSSEPGPRDSSTVLFLPEPGTGKWPVFHCSHSHCQGRTIRDVMQLWGDADRWCARDFQRRQGDRS